MNKPVRAPAYDLMKLIVAILLLLLFLILLWRGNGPSSPAPTFTPHAPPMETASATSAFATDTPRPPEASATATLLLSHTTTQAPPPEPSFTPTASSPSLPTFTPDLGPTITATADAPPSPIPTFTTCEQVLSRSQLQPGMQATIVRRLNFRSSPGIQNNWVWTNNPGTQVEIMDGPVCVPHFTGAYVWWQIKLPDGRIGWSAEGSLHGTFYFIEPSQ